MSEEVRYATGSETLNKALGVIGGLKAGDFTQVGMKKALEESCGMGVGRLIPNSFKPEVTSVTPGDMLAEGIDTLSNAKTFFVRQVLVMNGAPQHTSVVYAVYSATAGVEKGLFFVTRTLAEVHFANITGANREGCAEPSGGRTLSEIITHLFH